MQLIWRKEREEKPYDDARQTREFGAMQVKMKLINVIILNNGGIWVEAPDLFLFIYLFGKMQVDN